MARPAPSRPVPGAAQLLQLGATCGVMIGLGVLAGYLLDRALGTSPLLVFVGLAIGILAAATGSFFLIRPYVADASKPSGEGAPNPKE
jgi:F0F1-type ATP synthase assembly protein I